MRKRRDNVMTISVLQETREWLSHADNASRYVSSSIDWRRQRFTGSAVYLRRIDLKLIKRAIKALEGYDWPWYPDGGRMAERLAAAGEEPDWLDLIEAVKTMPRLAYALEAVCREHYSPNQRSSDFL